MAGDQPQRLDLSVDDYLSETGWETEYRDVSEDFSLIAAVEQETGERRIVLVAPSPDIAVTEQEVDWLHEQAEEFAASTAEITTDGTVTDEARRLANRQNIAVQDPAAFRATGTQTGQQRPNRGEGGPPPNQRSRNPQRTQQHEQSPGQQQPTRETPQQQPSQPQHPRGQQASGPNAAPQRAQPTQQESYGQPQQGQTSRRQSNRTDALAAVKDGFRPVGGFIYGAIGFLVALVSVTIYFFYRIDQITGDSTQVLPEEPQAIGWPFYNSNQVEIGIAANDATVETFSYFNEIDELNPLVFYAIIGFVLFLAGYSVTSRVAHSLSTEASAVAGASVLVGYVPLLAAGSVICTIEENGGSIGPELGTTLLAWGVLYAVVFGGLGGLVADQI
jgi:hypothetical protein